MRRKVCSIGNSTGITIPAEMLGSLHLAVGDTVDVTLDKTGTSISIEPVRKSKRPKGITRGFVAQVNEFIEKYRPALDALSKK